MTRGPKYWGWMPALILPLVLAALGEVQAASVTCEVSPAKIKPGQSATVTVRVASDVPLFGYTLKMRATPQGQADGAVHFDAAGSNWGGSAALIEEGLRDPTFTKIQLAGDDLFASTNTSDLSTVSPVAGSRDLLLQAKVVATGDADGSWEFGFVLPTSVLSDGSFQAIETTWGTSLLEVDSGSSSWVCGLAGPIPLVGILGGLTAAFIKRRV